MNIKNMASFYITFDVVRNDPDFVAQVFQLLKAVVVRVEERFDKGAIKYTAMSDQFQETLPEYHVPKVELIATKNESGVVTSVAVEYLETPFCKLIAALKEIVRYQDEGPMGERNEIRSIAAKAIAEATGEVV